jgi:hypothetical protein
MLATLKTMAFRIPREGINGTGETSSNGSKLAGLQQAHTPRRAPCLQPFVSLLLLLCRYQRLTCVAPFPNPGTGGELGGAAAAFFRHGLL